MKPYLDLYQPAIAAVVDLLNARPHSAVRSPCDYFVQRSLVDVLVAL
jgi:hypothetical protein